MSAPTPEVIETRDWVRQHLGLLVSAPTGTREYEIVGIMSSTRVALRRTDTLTVRQVPLWKIKGWLK